MIGVNERYVKNEFFLDYLCVLFSRNDFRILMFFVVLFNFEDIFNWLMRFLDNIVCLNWKFFLERFGILYW